MLGLLILLFACKKDSIENKEHSIQYEVTASNYYLLSVNYTNRDQQYLGAQCESGWKLGFTTSKKPFTATLRAVCGSTNAGINTATATVKIYVDGKLVKEESKSDKYAIDVSTQYVLE